MSAVALVITGLVTTMAPSISQAAPGANVALASAGAVVTASGNESATQWPYTNATDGDSTSRWSSNTADNAWLQVKLAEATNIDHVTILWEAACAAKYRVEVSNDGTAWTDATGEITNSPCAPTMTHTLNAATAGTAWQYVRMQGIERTPIGGTKYGMSLYEFQVWDGPEGPAAAPSGVNLVPLPQELNVLDDEDAFTLNSDTKIEATGDAVVVANVLAERWRVSTGFDLPVVASAASNSIRLVLDANYAEMSTPSAGEGYSLAVRDTGAVITATAAHGLHNGVQTLRQLFPPMIESRTTVLRDWSAPAVDVEDSPRFAHRGIQVDAARSFVTVPELKNIIDTISAQKQDRLHLHLADDQGWRIEITNEGREAGDDIDYTKLVSISSKSAMLTDARGYKEEFGRTGFYTQQDYKDIVKYAADRFITVIPEIDVPGHTKAMLHALPELNSSKSRPFPTVYGTVKEQNNGNVGESTLDVDNPKTFVAIKHIFGQIAAMTPGPYFHMGGDESHVTPHDDYVKFVEKTIAIVRELGKSTVGWNEVAVAGLTEGDVVQYWVGSTDPTAKAIADGAKVIVSKANSSYLDMKYHGKTPIGLTWAGQGDVDHYYNWNPLDVVDIAEEDDILGVEAPLWSETHRGGKQNEFLIFPRSTSHAEIGWSQQSQRNVGDFLKRLHAVGPRFLAMQTNFYDGPLVAWGTDLAGLPAKARTNTSHRVEVAHFVAPGTKVSADGKTVAVDSVDDADSASNSALTGPLTATIDFGDGTAAVDAVFMTDTPRGVVSAGSLYRIGADHTYATAGSYDVSVTLSDGRVGNGRVTVTNDYVVPVEPVFDDCQVPTMVLESTTARDDSRVGVTLAGLMPNEFLDILWDGTRIGSTVSDDEGNAFFSHYVPYQSVKGDHLLRVKDSQGRFVEKIITVDSQTTPPPGIAVTGVTATASSEAPNEGAPNGVATALVDGNPATFWHSKWTAPVAQYPHVLTFNLGKEVDLSQVVWTPRQNSDNGQVKTMTIEYSADGTEWADAQTVTLPAGRGTTAIPVDATATHIRITATAPQKAGEAFATAGEVQFRGLSAGQVEPEGPAPVEAETWTPPADCEVDPNPTPTVTVTPTVTTTPTTTVTPTTTTTATATTTATRTVTSTPTTTVTPTTTTTATATTTATSTVTSTPTTTVTPTTTTTVTVKPTSKPTVKPSVKPTAPPVLDVYSTPGYHTVNGRKWFTKCEPYSQTMRCRTEIWSTQVQHVAGKFVSHTGWHFNNLTYLESPRSMWAGNPLGNAGSWTATNGRQWRTECDTAATGGNGCRSYIWAPNTVEARKNSDGSYRYVLVDTWVFNNIVRFSK